jgi:hypothetical protein
MNRTAFAFTAVAIVLSGCKNTCCNKPSCTSCGPPPSSVLYSPATPSASNAPPEVWLPSPPAAPAPAPAAAAPAPTFPAQPQSSSYSPANPSRIASAKPAEISLEKPEFSETARREATSLKTVSGTTESTKAIAFLEIAPGRLATGPRPTLDELDRLARGGYRRAYVVGPNANLSDSDRRVFASRGLTIEAAPTRIKTDEPAYVFADDAKQLREWWIRYIKESEFVSDEAARIRADRLFQ